MDESAVNEGHVMSELEYSLLANSVQDEWQDENGRSWEERRQHERKGKAVAEPSVGEQVQKPQQHPTQKGPTQHPNRKRHLNRFRKEYSNYAGTEFEFYTLIALILIINIEDDDMMDGFVCMYDNDFRKKEDRLKRLKKPLPGYLTYWENVQDEAPEKYGKQVLCRKVIEEIASGEAKWEVETATRGWIQWREEVNKGLVKQHQEVLSGNSKDAQPKKTGTKGSKPGEREVDTPLYFYGQSDTHWGFLSQFFKSSFTVQGKTYICAEQYMMEQKAVLFGDHAVAEEIMRKSDPGKMKTLGRKVADFTEEVWRRHRQEIVIEGTYEKFRQNEELSRKLLATGKRLLVEASPSDRVWGIGFSAKNAEANRKNWGLNLLGAALMVVRQRLYVEKVGETGPKIKFKFGSGKK